VGLTALFFITSGVAQFPGYLASMVLVKRWGRKRTLVLFLILGGASGFAFATASGVPLLFASLALVSFFNLGACGAVYTYAPELFPTQYRATGFGTGETVGKLTLILGPILFGTMYKSTGGVAAPLAAIAGVMVVGGIFLAAVGPETKGLTFVRPERAGWTVRAGRYIPFLSKAYNPPRLSPSGTVHLDRTRATIPWRSALRRREPRRGLRGRD
jgi:MFS family permease